MKQQREVYICMSSVQFISVAQLCPTLCNPMDYSLPAFPVHHQLPESTQAHVHWVSDAIQPFHPLLSPSPPALNLSQHQGLLQWVSSSHQVAKVLQFQLQHQSFQWIFRTVANNYPRLQMRNIGLWKLTCYYVVAKSSISRLPAFHQFDT